MEIFLKQPSSLLSTRLPGLRRRRLPGIVFVELENFPPWPKISPKVLYIALISCDFPPLGRLEEGGFAPDFLPNRPNLKISSQALRHSGTHKKLYSAPEQRSVHTWFHTTSPRFTCVDQM